MLKVVSFKTARYDNYIYSINVKISNVRFNGAFTNASVTLRCMLTRVNSISLGFIYPSSKFACYAQLDKRFGYANFDAFMNRAFSAHSRFDSLNVRRAPEHPSDFCNIRCTVIAYTSEETSLTKRDVHFIRMKQKCPIYTRFLKSS